jgi:hypothetical protein
VLANDNDVEGDTLTATLSTDPGSGVVNMHPDGSFTYTPNENFNGDDSFEYTVSDGNGGTASATATINVMPVNDAPVAVSDEEETDENTALVGIDVLANDYDPDDEGEVLTMISLTDPAHGIAAIDANTITYTPDLWYSGEDSFTYSISDSTGLKGTATVTIGINDVIPSIDDINSYIQSLPESAFGKEAGNQKNVLSSKLTEVGNKIASGSYNDAINKLQNDIRAKADGSLGGNPKNDWITDPEAQQEMCQMIDKLISTLQRL